MTGTTWNRTQNVIREQTLLSVKYSLKTSNYEVYTNCLCTPAVLLTRFLQDLQVQYYCARLNENYLNEQ